MKFLLEPRLDQPQEYQVSSLYEPQLQLVLHHIPVLIDLLILDLDLLKY
ncbi:hypothetical protein ES703_69860 [subsurface metagenome]